MEPKVPHVLIQMNNRKQNLNKIYDSQVEMNTKCMKQRYYENGPTAKKLLVRRLRKQQVERSIHKVKDPYRDTRDNEREDTRSNF